MENHPHVWKWEHMWGNFNIIPMRFYIYHLKHTTTTTHPLYKIVGGDVLLMVPIVHKIGIRNEAKRSDVLEQSERTHSVR